MASQTDSEWTVEYDDRFARKETRGDDVIEMSKAVDVPVAADRFEVVGYIGDEVYHTTHASENEAMERVTVLRNIATTTITFHEGEDVYVLNSAFDPIVQRGVVVQNNEQHETVRVHFDSGPYGGTAHRTIDVAPSEMVHADADIVEMLLFIGRDDLLEPEDFAKSERRSDSAAEQSEGDFVGGDG